MADHTHDSPVLEQDVAGILDEDSLALRAMALLHGALVHFKVQKDLPEGICMAHECDLIAPHAANFRVRGDVLLQRAETLVKWVRQLQRIVSNRIHLFTGPGEAAFVPHTAFARTGE